jgi:hypothetical protein
MLSSHCPGLLVRLAYAGFFSHFSWYSKISSSTGPVKKIGSDTPPRASVMPTRSMIDPGRRPDRVPMSTPPTATARGADRQAQAHRKCLPYQRADGRVLLERVAEARRGAVHGRTGAVAQRLTEEDAVQPVPVLLVPRQVEAEAVLEQLELQRARRERDLAV